MEDPGTSFKKFSLGQHLLKGFLRCGSVIFLENSPELSVQNVVKNIIYFNVNNNNFIGLLNNFTFIDGF